MEKAQVCETVEVLIATAASAAKDAIKEREERNREAQEKLEAQRVSLINDVVMMLELIGLPRDETQDYLSCEDNPNHRHIKVNYQPPRCVEVVLDLIQVFDEEGEASLSPNGRQPFDVYERGYTWRHFEGLADALLFARLEFERREKAEAEQKEREARAEVRAEDARAKREAEEADQVRILTAMCQAVPSVWPFLKVLSELIADGEEFSSRLEAAENLIWQVEESCARNRRQLEDQIAQEQDRARGLEFDLWAAEDARDKAKDDAKRARRGY